MTTTSKTEFVWNDGGRAASGFVGLTRDCVTRSIAIATGRAYRDVYNELGEAAEMSPRNGVYLDVAADYLETAGWERHRLPEPKPFELGCVPGGVAIVHLCSPGRRSSHMTSVLNHVVHDTWNPAEDDYFVHDLWVCPDPALNEKVLSDSTGSACPTDELTQKEFEKIMRRLTALDNTAKNDASTEGEKRNALRMMQNLMLRHNLSREDITGDDNVEQVRFTRMACPVNGRRAYNWERRLAFYLAEEIFPMIQWYQDRKGHRTYFWFYGPKEDVENCIALFRELLLTIATAAQMRYGGHTRGSGASYAEGYVSGLPRGFGHESGSDESPNQEEVMSSDALIHARTIALHKASTEWLANECGIRLVRSSGSGRTQFDNTAAGKGKRDGAKHEMPQGHRQARIAEN